MPVDIVIMKAVSADNDLHAQHVRERLSSHGVLGLNMMSSPGSGKTALLEATLERMTGELQFGVIEGDVFTANDAERVAKYGVHVVQVNTEGSCHMTAHMIEELLPQFDLSQLDVLVIENIGNLICPTAYDLGEHCRVACLSTTEGPDKVEKYPRLFSISHVNVVTKADLIPHLDFDLEAVRQSLAALNAEAPVIVTSARTGEGLDEWCEWIRLQAKRNN